MKMVGKIAIPLVVIASGFAIMMLLFWSKEEEPKKPQPVRPRIVEAQVVELSTVSANISAFGRMQSASPLELVAEVGGKVVDGRREFRPGQRFSRGQLIAKIDDRQAIYNLNSAKSELLTALATALPEIKLDFPGEFEEWQKFFDACSFDNRLPELPEVTDSRVKLFLSRFGVYRAYFSARDLEVRLEKHYFRAPFDGSVVTAHLRAGANARVGATIGSVVDLSEIEVEMPISVVDVPWIADQAPVELLSRELGSRWVGEVKRLGSSIDERTQTVKLHVAIEELNRETVISGTFVEANMPGREIENAFTLPRSALYDEAFVYLVSNGELLRTEVNVVRLETESAVINGGLNNGDTVVVQALQGVSTGTPAVCRFTASDEEGEL